MNEGFGCHPGVGPNVDGLGSKDETRRIIVVRARDQMGSLRDNRPVADGNLVLRIECDAARNGALIGQLQVPGGPNFGTGVNVYPSTHFSPKALEQK